MRDRTKEPAWDRKTAGGASAFLRAAKTRRDSLLERPKIAPRETPTKTARKVLAAVYPPTQASIVPSGISE